MKATGPGQAPLLLPEIVRILERENLPYAIIGAMALAFHGVVRASLDVDILLLTFPKAVPLLVQALAAAGLEAQVRSGDQEDPILGLIRVRDRHGNQVDMLLGIRGLDSGTASRVVEAEHEGVQLRFVGVEDLIAMKLFAGAPLDIDDARRLLAVAGEEVNKSLLRRLAQAYGQDVLTRLERLVA